MSNRKETFNFKGYLLSLLNNYILIIYIVVFALENFFNIKYISSYVSLFFEKNR